MDQDQGLALAVDLVIELYAIHISVAALRWIQIRFPRGRPTSDQLNRSRTPHQVAHDNAMALNYSRVEFQIEGRLHRTDAAPPD